MNRALNVINKIKNLQTQREISWAKILSYLVDKRSYHRLIS